MKSEDLKRAYEKASTEKERAEIELRCWDLHGGEARRNHIPADIFLQELLGASKYELNHRLMLIRIGAIAEPLWPLVDGEMTLATAVLLARKARITQIAGEENAGTNAITRVLASYNRLPVKKFVSPGKFVRMGRTKKRGRNKNSVKEAQAKGAHANGAPAEGGSFRAKLRALVLENVTERLRGSDAVVVQEVVARFETDLKILLEDLGERIHERRRETNAVEKIIRRRDFDEACQVLHLDPPRKTDTAFEKIAKRNFKELARQYHTDVSGTDTKAAFDAVMKAWKTVQAFIERDNKKGI